MAQQLINGKQQFIDGNGNPLAGGSVAFYAPGTLNPVNTWEDPGLTTPNTNPVVLDANGMASVWGADGTQYRQVVANAAGVQMWDQVVGSLVNALAELADPAQGAALVAYKSTMPGAVMRAVSAKLSDVLDTADFGAIGDGATDDTAAVQNAINAAVNSRRALRVTGQCRITAPLIINRQVDTTGDWFNIYGELGVNGFLADISGGGSIFDSTITYNGVNPCVEFVSFTNLRFQASANHTGQLFSEKYLRMSFDHCDFRAARLINANTYMQTWRLAGCTIRGWASGWFIDAPETYDISIIDCVIENGASFLRSASETGGANSVRIIGCLIEGLSGTAIAIGPAKGVAIIGNYFEANGLPANVNDTDINLNVTLAPHQSILIAGNHFIAVAETASRYSVWWGNAAAATSIGNYADGSLHKTLAGTSLRLQTLGDFATNSLLSAPNKDLTNIGASTPWQITVTNGSIVSPDTSRFNSFIITCGNIGALPSFVAPTTAPDGVTIFLVIINKSGGTINALTFSSAYQVGAWTPQSENTERTLTLLCVTGVWIEVARSSDIAA